MGLLDGKKIVVTGVLTDASLAFGVARLARDRQLLRDAEALADLDGTVAVIRPGEWTVERRVDTGVITDDDLQILSVEPYADVSASPLPWLRAQAGLRMAYFRFDGRDRVAGANRAAEAVVAGAVQYTRDFLSSLSLSEQRTLHRLLLKASHDLGYEWQ